LNPGTRKTGYVFFGMVATGKSYLAKAWAERLGGLYLNSDVVRKELAGLKRRLKYILATYPDAEIAPRAKELLAQIQAGNPPKQTLSSWLPKVALPDWAKFSSSSEEEAPENQAAKD